MRPFAFINAHAGGVQDPVALKSRLRDRGWMVRCSSSSGDAGRDIVGDAVAQGADCLVAVGGDGTINRLVNGMMAVEASLPLGVIPMGTGNDIARTLNIPSEVDAAIEVVQAGHPIDYDVFSMKSEQGLWYGVNASSGGFGGVVDEALSSELKAQWGPLAYLVGAAKALARLEGYETSISYDEGPAESMRVLNVVVANGRSAAGGHVVAPKADPKDGLLDVVIVQWGPAAELTEVGARLMAGNYLDSPLVRHRRAQSVRVESNRQMRFNIDGELVAQDPVQFRLHPKSISVIAK